MFSVGCPAGGAADQRPDPLRVGPPPGRRTTVAPCQGRRSEGPHPAPRHRSRSIVAVFGFSCVDHDLRSIWRFGGIRGRRRRIARIARAERSAARFPARRSRHPVRSPAPGRERPLPPRLRRTHVCDAGESLHGRGADGSEAPFGQEGAAASRSSRSRAEDCDHIRVQRQRRALVRRLPARMISFKATRLIR